ncbi:MAG: serine hydrolase [Rhodoblastus sp.]
MIGRVALGALVFGIVAAGLFRVDKALRVAPNFIAETLCIETFVSGRDPAQAFAQIPAQTPGMKNLARIATWRVDREKREATAALAGFIDARAVHVGGYGCILDHGSPMPAPIALPSSASIRDEQVVVAPPAGSALALALDHVFAPFEDGRPRGTQAVVVLKEGRIVAERYADDVTWQTPLSGLSMTKSLTSALAGVLVHGGKLDTKAPGQIAAWSKPDDPRRAITVENLLRMESGLDFDETNSGFDANTHMLYLEDDMAAHALAARRIAAPGERWFYSSSSIVAVDSLLHEKVGGPLELTRFARDNLFAPAGITSMALGFDAKGLFVGGTYAAATARDWARFGELMRNDGVANGRRLLPKGWSDFIAEPTRAAAIGYGAGFWTNRGDGFGARARVGFGFTPDSYFASGSMGQRVIIVPSAKLVIARLGRTADWPDFDIRGTGRLVREVIAALE